MKTETEKLRDALGYAVDHIRNDLQPAFEELAETGKLPWPFDDTPYDEHTAAWRLATWWHGAGVEELLETDAT